MEGTLQQNVGSTGNINLWTETAEGYFKPEPDTILHMPCLEDDDPREFYTFSVELNVVS